MELSLLLLEQILAMMIMVFSGFILAKCGMLNGEESQCVASIVINVLSPALLLAGFQTPMEWRKLEGMLAALVATLLIYSIFLLGARLLRRSRVPLTPGEEACIVYSNSGNLIIPIVVSTLGSEYVIYSCSYLLVQNFLTWTHGQVLLGGVKKLTLKKIMLNPNIAAMYTGLVMFLCGFQLPGPMKTAVVSMGNSLGPIAMVLIGVMLSEVDKKKVFSSFAFYRAMALRLLIYPLLAIGILWIIERCWPGGGDVSGALMVMVLCASGPAAAGVTQMAKMYNNPEASYVSSIAAVTTLLSAATLPTMLLIYQMIV